MSKPSKRAGAPAIVRSLEALALISVFRADGESNELVATIAVDTAIVRSTPSGECIRVDVDALDDLPGLDSFLFHFLGTLKPIFPFARHFVAVLRDSPYGRVIFFSEPRDSDSARAWIVETGINGHVANPVDADITPAMANAGAEVLWRFFDEFLPWGSTLGQTVATEVFQAMVAQKK